MDHNEQTTRSELLKTKKKTMIWSFFLNNEEKFFMTINCKFYSSLFLKKEKQSIPMFVEWDPENCGQNVVFVHKNMI